MKFQEMIDEYLLLRTEVNEMDRDFCMNTRPEESELKEYAKKEEELSRLQTALNAAIQKAAENEDLVSKYKATEMRPEEILELKTEYAALEARYDALEDGLYDFDCPLGHVSVEPLATDNSPALNGVQINFQPSERPDLSIGLCAVMADSASNTLSLYARRLEDDVWSYGSVFHVEDKERAIDAAGTPVVVGRWHKTDDDSAQYVAKVTGHETVFDCIELRLINPETETFTVVSDWIDVANEMMDDIGHVLDILVSFDYSGLEDVFAHYGNDAFQVIAECIFESGSGSDPLFTGSRAECEAFIVRYIREND